MVWVWYGDKVLLLFVYGSFLVDSLLLICLVSDRVYEVEVVMMLLDNIDMEVGILLFYNYKVYVGLGFI